MSNPIVNGKRTHRKPRNGHNNAPGDRGVNGTRLSPYDDHRLRAKIDSSAAITRLNDFIKGEAEKEVTRTRKENGKIVKYTVYVPVMSATQVHAALGLLRKTLPDLVNTTISGDPDNPISIEQVSSREYLRDQLVKMGKLLKQPDGSYTPAT